MPDQTRIPNITTATIVSPDGRPLPAFKSWINRAFARIESIVADLATQLGLIAAAQATADSALAGVSAAAADGVVDPF
jgi:hypothetical protein